MSRRLRGPLGLVLAPLALCLLFSPRAARAAGDGHPHGPDVTTSGDPYPRLAPASSPAPEEPAPAEAKKEDDAKWDVSKPPGDWGFHDVAIDTDEGTWMTVDVSPDGRTLTFDLLGDIYTLPIGGGEATDISPGLAWEEQPRFSPDGKSIAFTSDRGGGDNIWITAPDGSNPRQVTKESYRLVNSPAWSLDGDWIAVRKHFTKFRSAGAGEIWLYHRSGGDGLQLTTKPNDQKDCGEPAFSPDGRYVYFSQDTTAGSSFEYNRDANGQIYVIRRLDRETGDVVDLVTGPGGAIRPTPSPDGKQLAYIRRVRFQSTLYVQDLASGIERPVLAQLDRDLQESWATHGVYPGMDWTPDSKSIVVWAGGKIHRVDAASGADVVIPFHVKGTRQVASALRYPVDVAPATFRPTMLRGVEVAPDGRSVVFETLGRLWIRPLPAGTARRLTRQEDEMEAFPSFSRDGKWIAYATMDDQKLGTVRIVSAAGGEGRALTGEPGHYAEPVFSPDGRTVVYRKMEGNWMRGRAWGREPGIYAVPVAGGAPRLVTRDGVAPQFAAASDRVYLMRFGDEDKRSLVSIGLDGAHERTHASSEAAVEFRLSPDGKWLAFAERYHVMVTPFVATGRALEIGPKASAEPLAKVARDAGDNLRWSGDSQRLHWSLGPRLFTRDLRDSFAFLAGAPEKLPEPESAGIDLSFDVPYGKPAGQIALVGGTVVTMRGDEAIADGVVLVDGNRIVAVGRRGEVAIPPAAKTIDVAGKTLIPGLVDVHWHGSFAADRWIPEQNWGNLASLCYGVTTLHDPSNDTIDVFAAADLQKAGKIVAPRIFSTGTILYGAMGEYRAEVDSLADAEAHMRRMKAAGAISVKSYNQPRREQRQQILAAARELGMMVVPEGGALLPMDLSMVVDGHTTIEHTLPIAKVYADVRQLWAGTKVGYTPTLGVAYGGLDGEHYWYAHTDVWAEQPLATFVPREILDERSRRRETAPEEEWNHLNEAKLARSLADAGVSIQLGAHGQREGLAAHWELWSFVQGGMTPMRALRAATIDGARAIGMDREIGSLEAGKLADLVVLDADPRANIRDSTKLRYVMANGTLYDAMTMNEVAPEAKARPPLWWETKR